MPRLDAGGAGGATASSVTDWAACADIPVIVSVDGTKIPTTKVRTYKGRDGVADKNTLTEVHFPADWQGRSVIAQIAQYDMASVAYQDARTGQRVPMQRGYVRSVGGSSEVGVAKMYISGLETLMTAIPFAGKYDEVPVSTILSDVQSEIQEKTQFTGVRVQTSAPSTEIDSNTSEDNMQTLGDAIDFVIDTHNPLNPNPINSTLQFRSNKHTLKDVMERITSIAGGYWYFTYDGENAVLVYDPTAVHTSYDITQGHRVIENDSLEEIMPFNSMIVNGETGVSIAGHDLRFVPSKKYPQVTVEYPPLTGRTGTQASPKVVESKAIDLETAKNVAKRKLKSAIQNNGEGDMKLWGTPALDIFDRLKAKPVCGDKVTSSVSSLDYEVQSITHEAIEGEYNTNVNTSIYVNYGDIVVTNAQMKSHKSS